MGRLCTTTQNVDMSDTVIGSDWRWISYILFFLDIKTNEQNEQGCLVLGFGFAVA
jgi:hypothetical protein